MRDDKTDTTTADHTHRPLPSFTPSIPCPDSDRCDTTGGPVPPSRRSVPVISRFHPVLGWRTILHLLARREAESITFSLPDRNVSWARDEDDLVQVVSKCSTSNILGRDCALRRKSQREVSGMRRPGHPGLLPCPSHLFATLSLSSVFIV